MSIVKNTYDDLLYILTLFSKKREELVSPFLNKDYEWIGLSFKYERNQAAFDLVRERFITLWIDKHIIQIIEDDIPEQVRNKAMNLLFEYINTSKSGIDDSKIKHSLLETKLKVIQALLSTEDTNTKKLNELRFSYEKDKAIFEREFLKYEKEIASNKIQS